jgi:hypothetical protein
MAGGLPNVNRIWRQVLCAAKPFGTCKPLVDSILWQILERAESTLGRPEIYRRKALQCLLAAERLRGPAERLTVLRIAQSWLILANRAARGTDQGSGAIGEVAAFADPELPPAIPL